MTKRPTKRQPENRPDRITGVRLTPERDAMADLFESAGIASAWGSRTSLDYFSIRPAEA